MLDLAHLPNRRPEEKVILFLRPFWFTLLAIFLVMALLYAVPLLLTIFFWNVLSGWMTSLVAGPALLVLATCYIAAVWLFALMQFTDYYLDTWIVTTERIINVDQHGIFNRTTSELHLANVQDVTSEVKGILQTFFGYGTISVQTAAEQERFIFENVPHPEQVKETVIRLVDEDKQRHNA